MIEWKLGKPEKEDEYLVTIKTSVPGINEVQLCYFNGKDWAMDDVIAWAEKPMPYEHG